MPPQQLPLSISLRDDATFDNFFIADDGGNRQLLSAIKNLLADTNLSLLFCWGSSGTGVTHLLQAACYWAQAQNLAAQYLPIKELLNYPAADLLEGMEQFNLLCLDDVQSALGNYQWEQAIFNLINTVRDSQGSLILGADASPLNLAIARDDLRSRFAWGGVYQVQALNDDGKKSALQFRAKARGMDMSDEVANFIINRAARSTKELFSLLDVLDTKSLADKRKLTIPFVREVIG